MQARAYFDTTRSKPCHRSWLLVIWQASCLVDWRLHGPPTSSGNVQCAVRGGGTVCIGCRSARIDHDELAAALDADARIWLSTAG
jgi:hypothetical protein